MAKWKTTTHGEILKGKDDPSESYIKVSEPMEKGQTYSLESKESRIAGIQSAIDSGKLDEEYGTKLLGDVDSNFPDFVRFKIIKRTKVDE